MVKIRLRRVGAKKQPHYRVVVTDAKSPRDGKFLETIGHYNPRTEPPTVEVDAERAIHWLSVGAQPTEAVRRMLDAQGILARFEAIKRGEVAAEVGTRFVMEPPEAEAMEPSEEELIELPEVIGAEEEEPLDVEEDEEPEEDSFEDEEYDEDEDSWDAEETEAEEAGENSDEFEDDWELDVEEEDEDDIDEDEPYDEDE
jgi:small subunit ribosomal protein S16